MELLETNDDPGAFERFTTAAWQRLGVRIAVGVAVALAAGVGIWTTIAGDDASPAASPAGAESLPAPATTPRDPDYYEPPPWVVSREIDWEVLGRLKVDLESPVYVVTFTAVNRSDETRRPNLKAVGRFVDDPGFRFTATCTGFDNPETEELRPLLTGVGPGEQVEVRCIDTMEYSGNRPDLDPRTLQIQGLPYDGVGGGPTVLYGVPGTTT
ncbi:MAG: hypothetical protein AVDCRST_MAG47-3218 [uncultured Nocardioidaceae bacterium]|uniref:Uncharacterized protein n=1 Tax=uncultured Nocardioidaceae bacterium TaxID=253824 RepID=A0A6J4NTZ4_9ACTN|nr:MAG: hypothetical protein AVDCRST_MAG47-3218 [uncultured Nocardioidaceae bacterium]